MPKYTNTEVGALLTIVGSMMYNTGSSICQLVGAKRHGEHDSEIVTTMATRFAIDAGLTKEMLATEPGQLFINHEA